MVISCILVIFLFHISINDPEGIGGVQCPEFVEGFADSYNQEIHESYALFNLLSDPIILQSATGNRNCYPFADTVDPQEDYPLSNNPPCVIPESGAEAVCAFKFPTEVQSSTECCGRDYELVTYDSIQDMEADGAMLTHSGGTRIASE